jgi:D-alanyl-D-alanine carboxypeptidase/D-alanyl-D-alanine-endopeptidase (penicillin-binding protein 4)
MAGASIGRPPIIEAGLAGGMGRSAHLFPERDLHWSAMRVRSFAVALLSALAPQLEHALHVPHVSLGRTGAVAIDLATGQTLYARNDTLPLIPASNEKLTVTYAALTALGPEFRIETDVLQDDAGDLILKGYGDPTLSSAQLTVLARQVRAAGVARVTGAVLADESWFDAQRTALGWKSSFYIEESPPLSALIVDRGRVGRVTSRDPALAAAQLFRTALVRAGVEVARGAGLGTAPADAQVVASVDSPTLRSIVHFMDTYSDNFYAEMLLKELGAVQAGKGTTAAGAGVVTGLLAQADVPLGGVRLVDGSGLSLLDRLTAQSVGSLLTVMWNDLDLRLELVASLPVAGRTGTLHTRMRNTVAAGVVRAKTGTTSNASALSGFVGDRYVFSILQNGFPVSSTWARIAQDRFAAALAAAQQP